MAEQISGTPSRGSYSKTPMAGGTNKGKPNSNQVLLPGKGNFSNAPVEKDLSVPTPYGDSPEKGPIKNTFPNGTNNMGKSDKFGGQDQKKKGTGPAFPNRVK